ncbi:MAG: metallophosphoesterase [Saprospiraceae bacterium]|nr:metallophosphoesterase [Pyrinomonadaceae bacterium]
MRRIVHISDIHFGQADLGIVERVVETINDIAPDLTVLSGDLTQRAKKAEFKAARRFLDRLPQPLIVVPGNHDVPLYNVFDRFVNPLEKYRKFISDDLMPFYADEEMAVLGINTARSLTIKGGRINEEQINAIKDKMDGLSDKMMKIIVTHHPFDLPEGFDEDDIVGNAAEAMPVISESGADIFLAGHLHVSHIVNSARRYKFDNGRAALIIQAGTAASVRVRGETNSFNLLEFEHPQLVVKRFECESARSGFVAESSQKFDQTPDGWAGGMRTSL